MNSIERIVSLFAPHTCAGCQIEGTSLCDNCIRRLPVPAPRCYRCHAHSLGGVTCADCRSSGLQAVNSVTRYEGVAKDAVWRLKFDRAQAVADCIARPMAAAFRRRLPPDTLVVPVPTAASRVRTRGYDQAALLARGVARRTGARYAALLTRHGSQRQVGATSSLRREQMKHAYQLKNPLRVRGARIILIDDVVTTGSTLEAAAQALRAAGARSVVALTFAQAAED